MLLFICPLGHQYGIAGYGEDLTSRVWRKGRMHDCPECKRKFEPNGPPFPGKKES